MPFFKFFMGPAEIQAGALVALAPFSGRNAIKQLKPQHSLL